MPKHHKPVVITPQNVRGDHAWWRIVERVYGRALNGCLVLGITAIFVTIVAQIVCRYILDQSLVWGEEISAYIMVWCGLLGAVSHFRSEDFMALTVVEMIDDAPLTVLAKTVRTLAFFAFAITLLVVGVHLVYRTSPDTRSAAAELPMFAVYLCIPVFAALILIGIPAFLKRGAVHKAQWEEDAC